MNSQPSQTNKLLLLIAASTPILLVMYFQNVNVWIILMFFTITTSQAFNLSTLNIQTDTHSLLSNKIFDIIDAINQIVKDYQGMYQNQVILKDKNDALTKSNEDLAIAIDLLHKDITELKIKYNP